MLKNESKSAIEQQKEDNESNTLNIEILPQNLSLIAFLQSKLTTVKNEDVDDAFFVCNLGDVIEKHLRWKRLFPRVQPHYAVKCCPDAVARRLLVGLGAGFDCASKNEIKDLIALGARPDDIIYAQPCKQASHIEYARDVGVKLLVFDNEEELLKTKKYYPKAELVLRIATDDSSSMVKLTCKFGAGFQDCPRLISTAKRLGLNVCGLSFMVGSGCLEAFAFMKAFKDAKTLFECAEKIGYKFTLLDIGGGYPGVDYLDITIDKIADGVNQYLEELFPEEHFKHLRVISEPGRYFAKSAFTLASNVVGKRNMKKNPPSDVTYSREAERKYTGDFEWPEDDNVVLIHGDGTKTILKDKDFSIEGHGLTAGKTDNLFSYYINSGIYGELKGYYVDNYKMKITLLKNIGTDEKLYPCCIWGPTHSGLDRVIQQSFLPEMDVGDWIIFHDAGDYTISFRSHFADVAEKVYYIIFEKHQNSLQSVISKSNFTGWKFISNDDQSKANYSDPAAKIFFSRLVTVFHA